MEKQERSELQSVLATTIARSEKTRDHFDSLLRKKLETTGKPLWDIERGKVKKPSPRVLRAIEEVLGFPPEQLVDLVHPRDGQQKIVPIAGPAPTLEDFAAEHGIVFLEEVDLALGMGATYLDGNAEVLSIVPFKEDWLRGIAPAGVEHLKVVRGRGDSMQPTIMDGDLVVVDLSQTRIDDQDRIWAIAYGDLGMIRRVRKTPRGSLLLMPDNSVVRPDEVGDGEAHIMGRVIWIGRRI